MENVASKNIDVYANVNICYLDPNMVRMPLMG